METLSKIASLELKQSTSSGRSRAGVRSARSAHRSANRAGAVLRRIRNRAALGHPRRTAAGTGRSPQPAAGAAQPDQEQPARARIGVAKDHLDFGLDRSEDGVSIRRVTDSGPGIPAGTEAFSTVAEGRRRDRARAVSVARFMRSFRGDLRHDPATSRGMLRLSSSWSRRADPGKNTHPLSASEHAAHTIVAS